MTLLIDFFKKSNKYLYHYRNNNHLLNGFFIITVSQQWNNLALPIFIKLMRSLNDKSVNKLSSRISSGISNMHFCIEFDIMAIELYDSNLIKAIQRLENDLDSIITH